MQPKERVIVVTPITSVVQPDSLVNQASGPGTIQRILQAIKQASARTGVDFSYLLNKASQESGFNPNATAGSSSATGLFQFTSQTWLQMVKNHGAQFGLDKYAGQIAVDSNGVAHVSDPATRHAILALRKDPTVSAEMAGELDKQNFGSLQNGVGGAIGPTDLYLAHFLGASGASDFINTMRRTPNASAAEVLPEAASANPAVFYDKAGAPRSLTQIYQQFAQKFDHAPQIPGGLPATAIASATPPASPAAPASFTVADAASTIAHNKSFVFPGATNIKSNTSSLYATMVLAQMDMHTSGLSALGAAAGVDHKKNPGLTLASGMA